MRIRLTNEADGRVCMESPYDPLFIIDFKFLIPYDGRGWDAARRCWIVSALYVDDLLTYCHDRRIQVLDNRTHAETSISVPVDPYALMPDDLRRGFACLFLAPNAPICVAEASYKALSRVFHPDMPDGSDETMGRINDAISTVRKYLSP